MNSSDSEKAAAKRVAVRGLVFAALAILAGAMAVDRAPWFFGGLTLALSLQSLLLLALGAALTRTGAAGGVTRWLIATQPALFQLTYAIVAAGGAATFLAWGHETHHLMWWTLGGFLGLLAMLAGGTAVYLSRKRGRDTT